MIGKKIRAVLLTGDARRHRYAAGVVAGQFDLAAIFSERKPAVVAAPDALSATDQQIIDKHFAEQSAAEDRWFGQSEWPLVEMRTGDRGEVSSPATAAWVDALHPEVIIVYGTGIIRSPLVEQYAGRMVNIHLGLSPYYRGSGTNFWPLVHRQPECVGATIHLISDQVDAGEVLSQVRPPADVTDGAHDLGSKTLIAALKRLGDVVRRLLSGEVTPRQQPPGDGKEYRRRDFNADSVRQMWQNFDSAMMREYVENWPDRDGKFPIVEH